MTIELTDERRRESELTWKQLRQTMVSAYERAQRALVELEKRGISIKSEEDRSTFVWVLTEVITDALLDQVEHARAQAPAVHVHIGGSE